MKTKFGILFTLLSVATLVVTACGSDKPKGILGSQRGNNMSLVVYEVTLKDAVYYGETKDNVATYYRVKPSSPDMKLAVVSITIRNDKSTQIAMNVDDKSYRLLDKDGKEFLSIDPFKNRELAPNVPNNEGLYTWVWGPFDIQKEFGVTGWALFEVPKDTKATQFRWDAVETIFVRFEN